MNAVKAGFGMSKPEQYVYYKKICEMTKRGAHDTALAFLRSELALCNTVAGSDSVKAECCFMIAWVLLMQDKLKHAEEAAEISTVALKKYKELVGMESEYICDCLYMLGLAKQTQGEFRDALEVYEVMLHVYIKLFSENDIIVVECRANIVALTKLVDMTKSWTPVMKQQVAKLIAKQQQAGNTF
jgi:hypothetical protein